MKVIEKDLLNKQEKILYDKVSLSAARAIVVAMELRKLGGLYQFRVENDNYKIKK